MKTLVIAGTHDQAMLWIKNDCADKWMRNYTSTSLSDYIIVSDANKIKGISNPTGVFVGTWIERKDLDEIFETILTSIHAEYEKVAKISRLWADWVRYHEKSN